VMPAQPICAAVCVCPLLIGSRRTVGRPPRMLLVFAFDVVADTRVVCGESKNSAPPVLRVIAPSPSVRLLVDGTGPTAIVAAPAFRVVPFTVCAKAWLAPVIKDRVPPLKTSPLVVGMML